MASSLALLWCPLSTYWLYKQTGMDQTWVRFEMSQNQSLKALHNDRCQCYWTVIIKASDDGLLQKWYYSRRLQAGRYDGLGQRLVKDPCIYSAPFQGCYRVLQLSSGSLPSVCTSPHAPALSGCGCCGIVDVVWLPPVTPPRSRQRHGSAPSSVMMGHHPQSRGCWVCSW